MDYYWNIFISMPNTLGEVGANGCLNQVEFGFPIVDYKKGILLLYSDEVRIAIAVSNP